MSPLTRSIDNVLCVYDQCIYWYKCVDQKRTRIRFGNLKNSRSLFETVMKDHTNMLEEEGYMINDSPILEEWYYENYNGVDFCPADVIKQIDRLLED